VNILYKILIISLINSNHLIKAFNKMETRGQGGDKGCNEHGYEEVKGFCKDCSAGICFRCAIGKHRNHNIVNIDELDRKDLETQIIVFENKIDTLKEKA
jgi:hypothetical protein